VFTPSRSAPACFRRAWNPDDWRSLAAVLLTRIVAGIQVFKAQRTDGRYLGDVLGGLGPMKVVRIARQDDNAAGRISLELVGIELIADANVKDAGDDRVDSILRMFVRHELYPRGYLDPDRVGPGLCWLADNDGKSRRRRESWKRLPLDIFREDRFEIGFAWLMGANRLRVSSVWLHRRAHRRPRYLNHADCFSAAFCKALQIA